MKFSFLCSTWRSFTCKKGLWKKWNLPSNLSTRRGRSQRRSTRASFGKQCRRWGPSERKWRGGAGQVIKYMAVLLIALAISAITCHNWASRSLDPDWYSAVLGWSSICFKTDWCHWWELSVCSCYQVMFSVDKSLAKLQLPELKCYMVSALGENGQILLTKTFSQNSSCFW